MRRRVVPVLLLAFLPLAGCGSEDDSASDASTAEPSAVTADDLDGSSYASTEVVGHELVEGTRVRVSFEDGVLAVSAGCNTMTAEYDVTGDRLAWSGEPAATLMGCLEDVAAQDEWLTCLFRTGVTAGLVDGDLELTQDEVILTLEPSDS
jgi:heat shock protein HslJ